MKTRKNDLEIIPGLLPLGMDEIQKISGGLAGPLTWENCLYKASPTTEYLPTSSILDDLAIEQC